MIRQLGHIALEVKDLDRSLRFYCGGLGLNEAFRLNRDDGSPWIVYLAIGNGTFIELFPAAAPKESGAEEVAVPRRTGPTFSPDAGPTSSPDAGPTSSPDAGPTFSPSASAASPASPVLPGSSASHAGAASPAAPLPPAGSPSTTSVLTGSSNSPALGSFRHVCLLVNDVHEAEAALRKAGIAPDGPPTRGKDRNWQLWVTDPDGTRIELMQIDPDSPQARADADRS